jgi:transposase InsO family protein
MRKPASFYFFKRKPIVLKDRYEFWRGVANLVGFNAHERMRNETLEYEWLYNFNLSLAPEELNPRLTEWLMEYKFNRPHQSLVGLAPVEYIEKELAKIRSPVLPMWSTMTEY